LQHLTGPVCPPLLVLCPAATAVIDGEGRRVNWTSHSDWRHVVVVRPFKAIRPCIRERFGLIDVTTSGHWSSVLPPRCWTQRPRPFARRLPESSLQSHTLVAIFGRYTDLLSADMGVRIIHRSTDFYTNKSLRLGCILYWMAYYIRSFTVIAMALSLESSGN